MLRDLDGMLVQFLVFAVCCCVCVAACNSVYILLVPGNEGLWNSAVHCPWSHWRTTADPLDCGAELLDHERTG